MKQECITRIIELLHKCEDLALLDLLEKLLTKRNQQLLDS